MTIKELCDKQEYCIKCPFFDACNLLDFKMPFGSYGDDDKAITNSIIETAKLLTESEVQNG